MENKIKRDNRDQCLLWIYKYIDYMYAGVLKKKKRRYHCQFVNLQQGVEWGQTKKIANDTKQ